MSDWIYLNRHRLRCGPYASTAEDGFNGVFAFPVAGEARLVCCIASDGLGWKHVSVRFGPTNLKTPSWEVMAAVKDLFWEPEEWVVQFHPAKSECVNYYPGCLHLWQPIGVDFPKPDSIMVGPRQFTLDGQSQYQRTTP